MNKHLKIAGLTIIMLIYSIGNIYSQKEQYKFRHLTTEDGLPINYCFQVMKDSRGFIWITTRAGLCRYDGYNLKVFKYDPHDSTSISDNRISGQYCMVEDTNAYLWIGTTNGLNRYDPVTETFKRYKHKPDDPGSISNDNIHCVYKDKEGTIWASTSWTYGLNKYEPETDKFRVYQHNPGDSGFQVPTILNMLEDRSGIFWLGTSRGVLQFDREKESFIQVRHIEIPDLLTAKWIKKVFEDTDGTMLFGTPYGFLIYDTIKNEVKPYRALYDEHDIVRNIDVLADPFKPDQTLWITAGPPLLKYDKPSGGFTNLNYYPMDHNGITGNLNSIYSDETGILWIPGTMGVNIMNPGQNQINKHHEFAEKYADKYNNAATILQNSQGHFWIGTYGHVLHFDKEMNLIRSYNSLSPPEENDPIEDMVWYIYEDREENMWFGTVYDGLYLLEKGKFDFLHCQLPVTGQVHVYDIFEDSRGELWVATNKGLMQRKKGGDPPTRFYQDTNWPGLHETSILCIYEDHKENLWIGTAIQAYGLFRQPPEYRGTSTFLQYKHDPGDDLSLSNDWVWCVQEDPFNNLWIATENGLNKYIRDKDYFERHINPTDQGANFIYDLSGDNNGYLWMATESGLVRYNPEMDIQNAGTTNNYKQFLAHRDIMCYHIYKSQSGKMFVGSVRLGENGYFSFHPDSLFENQQPPPVVITQFMVHNKVVESDSSIQFKKQIRLNYNQNFFSFEFAALDYYNPSQNEYAYILHGFDNDWTYSGNQRLARYTKVPPGKYIFQVKGSNSNGYWNEEGASIAISILPPPWKTWWAYSLYGIFLIGLFYLWRWYDLKRQKLRQELELEHVEAEKLKELDTMKSRFFANISHEFRTPLTLILGPLEKIRTQITDEAQKDLDIMHRNARRLQILINQLLSLSKLESGQMKLHTREENIVALVNGYIQSFESLAKQKNIDLSFTSLEKKVQLFVDKEKMEKILSNLLSNALKFTGEGGRIEVTVSSQQIEDLPGKWVRLIVSDTGRGILPDKLEHIFDRFYQADDSYTKDQEGTGIGLALTQELVELHHGKITVESESDKGTTLTVLLPLGKEHLKPEEIEDTDSDWDGEFVDWEDPGEQIVESGIHESLPDEDPEKEGSKPLLLIVEDNDDLRLYIRSYLAKDYSISEAIDGEMGLEKAIKNIPDLVISDVMMPKMDGYQLCRKLKTDERTSHIPVILLTAKASMEDKLEGLETGADDFLIKPFDQQELLLRIKNLIHQRRKLQQLFAGNISSIGELSDISITSMDKIFIQKSIEVVEKNISDANFSMEQFGQGMNMSRMQLHRKMRALVDQSPGEFIRTIRLNWAAILLKEKTANIAEIAYDVGFSNPSYFSECFRNQFGKLPSEYSD